ncbi:uncharacterized protein LTR77_007627 [Saxophila tyrrhenica]|uniref:Carbonic anhydrase n=1 Tax=Saxophila tyrrhenica TaxID=1690608 RepID=A0AAV9P6M1_9PEZI|nr:hypothetical protein LTR77_007627 [Saxophila tyrrhenica]
MATENQRNLISRNEQYASQFTAGSLPLPPAKNYLLGTILRPSSSLQRLTGQVTCMDARIDAAAAFGINLGDAHIIRNAGGNAKDALRSILISQHLLDTREILLIKHTGCGMLTFSNADALELVAKNSGAGVLSSTFDFQPFSSLEQAVKDDVEWLKGHGAVMHDGVEISGWVYEVDTGKTKHIV